MRGGGKFSGMMSLYQEVRNALEDLPVRPRKRYGQHFLIHRHVLDAIIDLSELGSDDEILEIGPGLGFLTRCFVEITRKVWAIEVDPFLVDWLRNRPWGGNPKLSLIHGDILGVDFKAILPDRKIKLAGNLPYNISTPILFRLIDERDRFSLMVLMLQKEVANRIGAHPGTKTYGTLSVWWQIHGEILGRIPVSAEAFFPRPKVQSMILKMRFFPRPLASDQDLPFLRRIVRAAFRQRRKTLGNALDEIFPGGKKEAEDFLRSHDVDPRRRGETLSVKEFLRLAQALHPQDLIGSDAQAVPDSGKSQRFI
jgi:16S rRNA (adenine1518-N6/adenine1519-N6)-dimethyltransferase